MSACTRAIEFIDQEVAAGSFPGAGLLVYHQGRQVAEHCQGTYCSSTIRDNPLQADVSHMLYSFSKGVSATVVAIARQKGLIDYDAPLHTYLPAYRGKWKDETTIRHLLNHTAGVPNCGLDSVDTEDLWAVALQTCYAAEVEWQPGSRSEYHAKSGVFLAAEAVRSQLPGRPPWEMICREWLLDPIGAETMTFKVPVQRPLALTPQPAVLPWAVTPAHFPHLGHPGSGIFGRLDDMIKVLQLQLNGGTWNGQVILAREHVAEMHRVQHRADILEAQTGGRAPAYEPFGLGWKVKLDQQDEGFGLGNRTLEGTFGHAGIWTVMGVGIPQSQVAIAFITTNPIKTSPELARIRNQVTDLLNDAYN